LKILQVANYVTQDNKAGGPASVAQNLHAAFRDLKLDSEIFALSDKTVTKQNGINLFKGYSILKTRTFGGIWSARWAVKLLPAVIKSDVVHIHMGRDLASITAGFLCLVFRKKYFIQPHGMLHDANRPRNRLLDMLIVKSITRGSNLVFCLSNDEAQRLIESNLAKVEQIRQVSNGIPRAAQSSSARRSNVVGFVGRLHYVKQPLAFIEVARLAMQRNLDLSFEIVGPDGGQLQDVIQNSKSLGNIEYLGSMPNNQVKEYLSTIGVLVVPSLHELFPMVVVEALCNGTPVVIMENCGLARMVSENNFGKIAENSEQGILDAVVETCSSVADYSAISTSAAALFDIESVAKVFVTFYSGASKPRNLV
jgi:glycosyltransferase involved in cell wall biosynthesis